MNIQEGFYTVEEVAGFMCTTPTAIYVAVSEGRNGITIPASVKLGRRRLFLKRAVHDWFDDLYQKTANNNAPRNHKKESSR